MAISLSEKLGYVGVAPFVLGALGVIFHIDGGEHLFKLYSLLVLTFMAGACWGVEQAHPEQIDEIPTALSVGVFIWGVLAYILPLNIAVLMFTVGFWVMLWTETNPIFVRVYDSSYKRMRNVLTGVVTALNVLIFLVVN